MRVGRVTIRNRWLCVALFLICLGALICVRYWPRAPLSSRIASSVAIFDAHGELLRLTTARDQQYRAWTSLADISPQLVDALLLHEDQYFYRHFGVNPFALLRAATTTFLGGTRQGGSTLTMQLARELYQLNTRTLRGKCSQIVLAIGLELRYSKRDILEAHLNLMPYGGNLQGVGTASLVYFGKNADRLSLGETLTLVVIPQAPLHRDPKAAESENLRAARERLFARWVKTHPDAKRDVELMSSPLRYASLDKLPFIAPHFTALLLDRDQSRPRHAIQTTLDLPLQRLSERILSGFVREQSRIGIQNAALLLVDHRDMSVRAMVGSADFYSYDISGQVNGALAKRSPGSALKPFIYALAIDQGLIHPLTMLKDAPANFGGFSPENFDGRFVGPLTATDALTR
ncbi:MAG TPA: transglycosylase domain-containing protein, partial [Steroidobacteraceae bacterium]|nr:transglycosylase domain-containing protein [Steroidobacteraceae bacterium]